MSKGPGVVQRAIIDSIGTDEAMATYTGEETVPGPVGVPLAAVFVAAYGTDEPTRSQESSMERALRMLRNRGLVSGYGRWCCPVHHTVIVDFKSPCCDNRPRHSPVIGRPSTDDERVAAAAWTKALFSRAGLTSGS